MFNSGKRDNLFKFLRLKRSLIMQKLEILLAFVLSAYFTYVIGISATMALFVGWGFANIFELMKPINKQTDNIK